MLSSNATDVTFTENDEKQNLSSIWIQTKQDCHTPQIVRLCVCVTKGYRTPRGYPFLFYTVSFDKLLARFESVMYVYKKTKSIKTIMFVNLFVADNKDNWQNAL